MIKNYLTIAWRNIWRKKSFSFINLLGLSIGMAASILIILWIQSEWNYDKNFTKGDRIYEVWNEYKIDGNINSWRVTPKVMAAAIQADYDEVEHVSRVERSISTLISVDDLRITGKGMSADSIFFEIFDYEFIQGNKEQALMNPDGIVLTEEFAEAIFGKENALGKIIKLDNELLVEVTGVIKNPPADSRFAFQFITPWARERKLGNDDTFWSNNSTATYVLLKEAADLATMQEKLKDLRKRYDKGDPNMVTFLYPFTSGYLKGQFINGKEVEGRMQIVRMFGWVAALILLVACINFMNLSTARSEKRAKEVGIRKVIGARRGSLILQFIGESILLSFIAGVFALVIVQLSLPAYNQLVAKQLTIEWANPKFWGAFLAFIVITGILAGSYPALFLSAFNPITVFKGSFKKVQSIFSPRKVLVTVQFSFTILLIISVLVIRKQIIMAENRPAGYERERLIYHFMEGDVEKNYLMIKQELLASGQFESITKTNSPLISSFSNSWMFKWKGRDPQDRRIIERFCADDQIVKTAGFTLLEGRDFDLAQFPSDSNAVILNESAVTLAGFEEPLGQIISDNKRDYTVVGVVKDFIIQSPYSKVNPMIVFGASGYFNVIHFRIQPEATTDEAVATLESVFKKYNPEFPFNYRFVDEEYGKKFGNEKRTSTLASLFAILTVFISCLGLLGLAAYMAENRTKEIGIRKVLGASVPKLTGMLSMEFIKLVFISFFIAAPLGYYFMSNWLSKFTYRTKLEWWLFALAGCIALVIALITVGSQAIRAARANPIRSLRSE